MKKWFKSNRGFVAFLLCFGFIRLAIADYNPIPSGSMRPTILEGDVVLVNRIAYDLKLPLTDISLLRTGEPQRGEIVTFTSPKDGVRLIKRLVGLPGDVLEMRHEILFINGVASQYSQVSRVSEKLDENRSTSAILATEAYGNSKHSVQFLPEISALRDFGPVHVPQDAYFFLGDNRDNSADSRYIGFVSRSMLIGRAHHIMASANILGNWLPRLERFGSQI